MAVSCSNCGVELKANEASGHPCPECGQPLVRNFVLHAGPGNFVYTGAEVEITYRSYPEALHKIATEMFEKGQYSISIVIAQMAAEISVERSLDKGFKDKEIEFLQEAVTKLLPSRNITNERVRKLYSSLHEDEIQNQEFWEGLTKLSKWRNEAVHKGKICTEDEAVLGLDAAKKIVLYLKDR